MVVIYILCINVLMFVFDCRLLVYDEGFSHHKHIFEALDRTLRDVRRNNDVMFGGLTVVICGDLMQTLPVVIGGNRTDEVAACLITSHLIESTVVKWHTLEENVRVQRAVRYVYICIYKVGGKEKLFSVPYFKNMDIF